MQRATYELSLTTQGPSYPPSEVMDQEGNFIVIGCVNKMGAQGQVISQWSRAVVSSSSVLPPFGEQAPYEIVRELADPLSAADAALVLHTLPLPLPCNNYPMLFAPEQHPAANNVQRPSYAFHQVPIPDMRADDGPKVIEPITLGQWSLARGTLEVSVPPDRRIGNFRFEFSGLIPNSMYTVMSLRQHDLNPLAPTRPGPLGIPNVLMADNTGSATYEATLPNPFPSVETPHANRIVNVVLLWMSYQMNRGGAIGGSRIGWGYSCATETERSKFQ